MAVLVPARLSATCSRGTPQRGTNYESQQPLYPLWDEVIETTLDFSGIRLRNAGRQ
jgi:hypothetical protein